MKTFIKKLLTIQQRVNGLEKTKVLYTISTTGDKLLERLSMMNELDSFKQEVLSIENIRRLRN
jgi:hypothetical protein